MADIYENKPAPAAPTSSALPLLIAYWLLVGVPLVWGVLQTLKKSLALFGG